MQIYGPKRTRKRAKKGPKIPGVDNLTPASNSTLKITIETGLRPFYNQKNDTDAPTLRFRLQSRYLLLLNAQGLIRAHRVEFFSKNISDHGLVLGRPEYYLL